MKISVLYTPALFNIGNDFINQGAREFIKKCFSVPPYEINELEVLETGNKSYSYPTDYLSPIDRQIAEQSELLIFVGGSCLSRYYLDIFKDFAKFSGKKIIIGASFYENIDEEQKMYEFLPPKIDHIFVRDNKTYEYLSNKGEHNNVYLSVDLGLFMEVPKETERKHVLVNIDAPESSKLMNDFYSKHYNSILMWNRPNKVDIANSHHGNEGKRMFVAEKTSTYLRMIRGAKLVYTNRVHTFVACILCNTPCEVWYGVGGKFDRHFLFKEIGIEIVRGKTYFNYEGVIEKIKKGKEEYVALLKNIIDGEGWHSNSSI